MPAPTEGVVKGTTVILSDSEESAFAAVPREINSRSFTVETVKESTARADFATPVLNVLLVRFRSSPQTRPARDDSFTVSIAQDDNGVFC